MQHGIVGIDMGGVPEFEPEPVVVLPPSILAASGDVVHHYCQPAWIGPDGRGWKARYEGGCGHSQESDA